MNPTQTARIALFGAILLLAACARIPLQDAPIIDRTNPPPSPAPVAPAVSAQLVREAHSGTYVTQKGDTLYSIALAFGQDFRDIARWNGIDDPSRLAVGRSLRVAPPDAVAADGTATTAAVAPPAAPQTRSLEGSAPAGAAAAQPAVAAPAAVVGGWGWPVDGKVVGAYDPVHSKGIDIAAESGAPVLAAADGQVVYAGNGLRAYGNLVIIKHNDDYVSAYGHNRANLVAQGQEVKRGQKIAEVGLNEGGAPRLHFEIRRGGKPVDPLSFLAAH